MRTPGEVNINLESTSGTLKVSINKLPGGKFRVDSSFFGKDGYYIAHKSNTRIADNIDDLIRT